MKASKGEQEPEEDTICPFYPTTTYGVQTEVAKGESTEEIDGNQFPRPPLSSLKHELRGYGFEILVRGALRANLSYLTDGVEYPVLGPLHEAPILGRFRSEQRAINSSGGDP